MSNKKDRISGSLVLGLLFIVLGALWVLNNTKVLEFEIHQWWPLILIVAGLIGLVNRRRFYEFGAWLLIAAGVIFLLVEHGTIAWNDVWKFWPVILVFIGIHLIFRGRRLVNWKFHVRGKDKDYNADDISSSDGDRIGESCFFAGGERRFNSGNFRGGSISVLFGGMEIDLREADLAGQGGVLDISAIFGGVEIRLPDSWVIEDRSTAILGGVDFKCSNPRGSSGKRLVINASAIFGGIDIKN